MYLSSTRRHGALMTLVLAVALAAGQTPSLAEVADDDRTIEWGLTGCHGLIVLIPVPAESLEPLLPSGFTATLPDSVADILPPDPRLEAVVGMEVLDCQEGEGLIGPIDGLDYASFWTFVEPPAELAARGHDLSFVKWDTMIPDQLRRDLLRDHGLAARGGDVTFDVWSPLPLDAGVVFDAGWTFSDGESYRFTGAAVLPVDFEGSFIEYAESPAGLAEWETLFKAGSAFGGVGVADLDPAGWPADVLGTTRAQAYFLVPLGLDFYDATLTLPPDAD